MYDHNWARSIYEKYTKLHPRAQQIDSCIVQLIASEHGQTWIRKDFSDAVIASIQGKRYRELWGQYKRLVKRSPLDRQLLYKVARNLSSLNVDEGLQLKLEF